MSATTPSAVQAGNLAVITGAGSGLGLELARLAARKGLTLALGDVQADALAAAEAELKGTGVEVFAERLDVSSAYEVEAFGAKVFERFGAPHLVFNNAGVGFGGFIWEHSVKDWEWVLGVNLWGVAHGVRVFTPMMLAQAKAEPSYRGRIINTASMAGMLNAPNLGVYNVSKHAVVSLSETLYQDLKLVTEQVSASVLCPYFVATGIHQSHRNRAKESMAKPTRSQLVAQVTIERAVSSGRVTAPEVAALTFAAIEAEQFYIFSHPQALGLVRTRLEDVLGPRNPSDPYADKPELGEALKAALHGKPKP